MRKSLFVSTTAAGLLAGLPFAAQAEDAGPTAVDAVVVTANRSPEAAGRVGQQITVLDRAELQSQQTPVLTDILARTPGLAVARNGGVGAPTQVYVRGAESGQTVVLIDGVKLNDPSLTDTGFNFGNLLVGDVARVEVLRGPQSVLWGSQAIGGVVNLITAEAERPFESNLTLEGGSDAWAYGRAGVGGKTDRAAWRANLSYLTTHGVSAFADGAERDGYRNLGASGKAKVALTDQLFLDLRAVYSRGRSEFDGFAAPTFAFGDTREYGVTEDFVGYAGLNLDLLEGRLTQRAAFAYTRTDRESFDPDQAITTTTFRSDGRNERFEYQGTYAVTERWTAVFGAETERSRMRSASPSAFDPDPTPGRRSARLDSVYAQVRGEVVDGLTLSGGLRRDEHDDFGGHTVGQLAAAWSLNDGATVLRASWGEGFKAPSLYQLGSEYGNAGLRPETAEGWDVGIQQGLAGGRVVVSAAWFERRAKDQIDFFSCLSGSADPMCLGADGFPRFGYYANVARTETRGVELAARADVTEALTLDASYTWLDAENDTAGAANQGRRLPRRPEHAASAEATWRWPVGLSTTLAVRYAGDRFDDAANSRVVKGHVLWDLRGAYAVTDRVEVYGRVENLFDERYVTIRNYGQAGRTAYAGVRATF